MLEMDVLEQLKNSFKAWFFLRWSPQWNRIAVFSYDNYNLCKSYLLSNIDIAMQCDITFFIYI